MNIEEVKKFLEEEDEGKALLDEYKKPLIQKRDELLGEMSTLKEKVKSVGNVDELRSKAEERDTFEKQLEEYKNKASQGDEKYDQLKQSFEQKLEEERKAAQTIKEQFKNSKLDSLVTSAISKHKGVPELLKPVVQSRIKAEFNETGDVDVTVLDKNGKPYYKDGEEATVENIVEELKSDELYRRAFDGTGSSGSGTRQTSNNVNTAPDMDSKDFNLTEAMKQAKSRG